MSCCFGSHWCTMPQLQLIWGGAHSLYHSHTGSLATKQVGTAIQHRERDEGLLPSVYNPLIQQCPSTVKSSPRELCPSLSITLLITLSYSIITLYYFSYFTLLITLHDEFLLRSLSLLSHHCTHAKVTLLCTVKQFTEESPG